MGDPSGFVWARGFSFPFADNPLSVPFFYSGFDLGGALVGSGN